MQKKAKLVSFSPTGRTWTNAQGQTYYNQSVEFDNSDKGEALTKDQSPSWVIGKEYNYDIEPNGQYGNKIKGMKAADAPAFGNKGGGGSSFKPKSFSEQVLIASQNATASAVNFYAQRGQSTEEQVLAFAQKILNFNLENYKKAKDKEAAATPQPQAQPTPPPQQQTQGLPTMQVNTPTQQYASAAANSLPEPDSDLPF